jgi:hypothetical protein
MLVDYPLGLGWWDARKEASATAGAFFFQTKKGPAARLAGSEAKTSAALGGSAGVSTISKACKLGIGLVP